MKHNQLSYKKLLFLTLYILSTLFFLIQHYFYSSWDFQVYVLNAKYWLNSASYFEIGRPPLMPFILTILSIFTFKGAEFIYILLVSTLYAYTNYNLAKKLKIDYLLFYALALNPYLLIEGLYNGTELLSITLIELSILSILNQKIISGFFLGLSALSRYTALLFFPLLVLHMNIKKIIKSFILYSLPLIIWFSYNYYKYKNFFTSIADQYALNILFRAYIVQPPKIEHFLIVLNILIIFFILGLIIEFFKVIKNTVNTLKTTDKLTSKLKTIIEKNKINIILIFILIYSIYTYLTTPLKIDRYLFYIFIPAIYYSYQFLEHIINLTTKPFSNKIQIKKYITFSLVFILLLITLFTIIKAHEIFSTNYQEINKYIITDLKKLKLENCTLLTNDYPMLNYIGLNAYKFPRQELFNDTINSNYTILLFYPTSEPEYANNKTFMYQFPTIKTTNRYAIYSNNNSCIQNEMHDKTYLQTVQEELYFIRGINVSTDPCFIILHKSIFLEKVCNLVNLKGFKVDENRLLA